MIDYEELNVEREYSQYPRGLKHYSKKAIIENSLFDIDLLAYKIASILKGENDGKRNKTGDEKAD